MTSSSINIKKTGVVSYKKEILKTVIKSVIPKGLISFIRKKIILRKQRKVAKSLSWIVEDCVNGQLDVPAFTAVKDISGETPIVWQYWAQGAQNAPELVQICLKSVDKYASDCNIIRLDDKNLSDYITMPDWLLERKKNMSPAHFSDILRCTLLTAYGGLWLDASTLLTGKLPDYLFKYDFFAYRRDKAEKHKKYWENTFAFYWGWDTGFRVNVLIGIMRAKQGNKVISDITTMLFSFWKSHTIAPDYFFFQILFDLYIDRFGSSNLPLYNDCVPHMLRQAINSEYPYMSVKEILSTTTVHSLNYKNPNSADCLKALLSETLER